jgi:ABC-type multidrug transport system ATPase subunit
LVLFDEPTAGLDPEQRVEFRALLRELGTTSTVVVATHLVEDVAAACTHVTLMESGRVAYQGTPQALAALGADGVEAGAGDSAIERGYLTALGHHRAGSAVGTSR